MCTRLKLALHTTTKVFLKRLTWVPVNRVYSLSELTVSLSLILELKMFVQPDNILNNNNSITNMCDMHISGTKT